MTHDSATGMRRWASSWMKVKVWHLALLVGFVAVAIAQIQDHRRTEPFLVGLAGFGFVLYWMIGWAGWRLVQRWEPRMGSLGLLLGYLAAMALLFLAATVAFLVIEYVYLEGGL